MAEDSAGTPELVGGALLRAGFGVIFSHLGKNCASWPQPRFKVQVRLDRVSANPHRANELAGLNTVTYAQLGRDFHMGIEQVERFACLDAKLLVELIRQQVSIRLNHEHVPKRIGISQRGCDLPWKDGLHAHPLDGIPLAKAIIREIHPMVAGVALARRRAIGIGNDQAQLV